MDRKQAIEFGESRRDLFGGQMEEFIKLSVKALKEQRPKGHWIDHIPENLTNGDMIKAILHLKDKDIYSLSGDIINISEFYCEIEFNKDWWITVCTMWI